jgi:ABC-type lipoprotein release transport system permease subunit
MRVMYLLVTVAALILLTACMNYMNLATVLSERRTREVGLRKAAGAGRVQIMRQFLCESVLLSCLSMILAIFLAEIFLPGFNDLIEIKDLDRINRIDRKMRPSAGRSLAAGEKIPDNLVDPV